MKEKYVAEFEIKSLAVSEDKATATITGYAAIFNIVDSHSDIIQSGAFKSWLSKEKSEVVPILLDHIMDMEHTAGLNYSAKEDANGLFVIGELNLNVPAGKVAYENAKQAKRLGKNIGLSIGYFKNDYEIDYDAGVRYLKSLDVVEYSFTHAPSNKLAGILDVKSVIDEGDKKTIAETKRFIERTLRDVCGVSKKAAETAVSSIFSEIKDVDVLEQPEVSKEDPEDEPVEEPVVEDPEVDEQGSTEEESTEIQDDDSEVIAALETIINTLKEGFNNGN